MPVPGTSPPRRERIPATVVVTVIFAVAAATTFVLGLSGLLAVAHHVRPPLGFWGVARGLVHLYTGDSAGWPGPGVAVPLSLEIAEVLGPMSTTYAVGATAVVLLTRQVRLLRARLARQHSVVCGGGRSGVWLARALAEDTRTVLVDLDASSERTTTSLVRRVIPLSGDPRDGVVLGRAGVTRAREIFAVAESDADNASIAIASRAATAAREQPLNCYALVADRDLHLTLQARQLTLRRGNSMALHLLDRDQLYASAVIGHEAPDPTRPTVLSCRGELSHALGMELVRALTDSPRRDTRPTLLLAGSGAQALKRAITIRWAEIDTLLELGILDDLPRGLTVYVGDEDDRTTLRTGLTWLNESVGTVARVVLCMEAENGLSTAFSPHGNDLFGGLSSLLRVHSRTLPLSDPAHIRSQTFVERLARRLHLLYLQEMAGRGGSSPDALRPWSELPDSLRSSNRDQAADIGHKLTAAGYSIIPAGTRTPGALEFSAEQVEVLAQLEHERWMAERMARGLSYGPTRTGREHPDLVPWESLDESAKEKDRIFVRRIPRLLLAEGFETVAGPAVLDPAPDVSEAASRTP